jgi:hypothetical protein
MQWLGLVGIFGRAIDMKGDFSLPKQPQGRDGKFPAHPRRRALAKHGAGSSFSGPVRQGRSVGIRLTVMRKPQAIMSAIVRRTKKASRAGCCPRSECVATMAASPRMSPEMMTACGADRGALDHTASHKLSSRRQVSRLHSEDLRPAQNANRAVTPRLVEAGLPSPARRPSLGLGAGQNRRSIESAMTRTERHLPGLAQQL